MSSHPSWVLGFQDETWWSRTARPSLHAWSPDDQPLRLIEQTVAKDDPDSQALAADGLLQLVAARMRLVVTPIKIALVLLAGELCIRHTA